MEWLFALFLITTPLFFWGWAVVFFCIIMFFEENEKNLFAFISLGIFIALAIHSPVISIAFEPMIWLLWAAAYYACGGVWSFIKWFSFISKRADAFGEAKLDFLRGLNKNANRADAGHQLEVNIKTPIPPEYINVFKSVLRNSDHHFNHIATHDYETGGSDLDDIVPLASTNKERIVTWILWWPTSAFWTILNDPLVRLANWMYARFQGMYTRIANRAFAKFGV